MPCKEHQDASLKTPSRAGVVSDFADPPHRYNRPYHEPLLYFFTNAENNHYLRLPIFPEILNSSRVDKKCFILEQNTEDKWKKESRVVHPQTNNTNISTFPELSRGRYSMGRAIKAPLAACQ